MRALIVSYYFPPAGGGGVQRVLKWAQYLPQHGVDVDVLAPDTSGWLQEDASLEIPDSVTVHRARNRSPKTRRPAEELAGLSGPRRMLHRAALQPRRLLYPDIHAGWTIAAAPRGIQVVAERGIDVVISTSPPKTCHVIARRIARATGVPWIADFRDSWLDLPHLRLDNRAVQVRQAVNIRYATRLLSHAAAITTVSEPLARDLRRRHPEVPVHVITNGVDFAQLTSLPATEPLLRDAQRADRWVISYTGNFFGRQSPTTFLQALRDVIEAEPDRAASIVVRCVGGLRAADQELIASSPALREIVECVEFLPHDSVLAEQRAADMLFLYVAPGRGSEGIYTGKAFEYVASGRPILALAPSNNVAAQLVRDANAGIVVDPEDVASIANALRTEHDRWKAHGRAPTRELDAEVRAAISREHQALHLAELVQQVATR